MRLRQRHHAAMLLATLLVGSVLTPVAALGEEDETTCVKALGQTIVCVG